MYNLTRGLFIVDKKKRYSIQRVIQMFCMYHHVKLDDKYLNRINDEEFFRFKKNEYTYLEFLDTTCNQLDKGDRELFQDEIVHIISLSKDRFADRDRNIPIKASILDPVIKTLKTVIILEQSSYTEDELFELFEDTLIANMVGCEFYRSRYEGKELPVDLDYDTAISIPILAYTLYKINPNRYSYLIVHNLELRDTFIDSIALNYDEDAYKTLGIMIYDELKEELLGTIGALGIDITIDISGFIHAGDELPIYTSADFHAILATYIKYCSSMQHKNEDVVIVPPSSIIYPYRKE